MSLNWRGRVTSLAVLALGAFLPLISYIGLAPEWSADLSSTAQHLAAEYDRLLTLRRRQVFSFAALPSIRAFAATTPETRAGRAAIALNELQSWVASDRSVRQVSIVDSRGFVTMTTLDGWNSNMSARRFVQEALAGELAVSPPSRDVGEFSTYYAAPILNNAGDIAGALVLRVAAQELWEVATRSDAWYTVLADENGVRLDDSGDPARRLAAFGPLDDWRAARVAAEQTYGAELPEVRASDLTRAQAVLVQGARGPLTAEDFRASEVASRRLATKPWTVIVIAPAPSEMLGRLAIPVAAALALALGGTVLLELLIRPASARKGGG